MKKIISIFTAIVFVSFSFGTYVSAEENKTIIDQSNAISYVSEKYSQDPIMAAKVEEKQKIAEELYEATIKGDTFKVKEYSQKFEKLTNPKLFDQKNIGTSNMENEGKLTRTSYYDSLPSSFRIGNLFQVPQEKTYYCGPAAAKSILDCIGINKSQTTLASSTYLKTEQYGNTPWYLSNGNHYSQFPMYNTLMDCQWEVGDSAYGYVMSPLGNAGSNPLTVDQCKSYVMGTTSAFDRGYGVAACGQSKNASGYKLPGYPSSTIGHWLVSDGYADNGNLIWIVDPAKSSVISWSGNISAYYQISATLFRNFISPRGMIW